MPQSIPIPPRAIRVVRVDPALRAMDIGNEVVHAVEAALPFMRKPSMSRKRAPRSCWEFLRHCIAYVPEYEDQMIRMPWRTIKDGRADCKSQSVFTAAVCHAAGCNVELRIVQLHGDEHFGHVYAIVDGTPVDPLLPYGTEVSYIGSETIPIGNGKAS
jgi:hypothetical protein